MSSWYLSNVQMKSEERKCHVAAVHHDHIPCAKPMDYELDHMYSTFKSEPRDNAIEIHRLKELCLFHVDYIEKQAQELIDKDKKIKELAQQIDKLKQRLRQAHERKRPVIFDPTTTASPPKKPNHDAEFRKRSDTEEDGEMAYQRFLKTAREKCRVKGIDCQAGNVLFCTPPCEGTSFSELLQLQPKQSEVPTPSWREQKVFPSYQMEGTEDIEEDTFSKRHQKHETMEKRRKRWDIQRLREESHKEKLQERAKKRVGKAKKAPKVLTTFYPDTSEIRYLAVSDGVPICALGTTVPNVEPRPMRLRRPRNMDN